MLARTLVIVILSMHLAACVDSQRLRSSLGGPPAATDPAPSHEQQSRASRVPTTP
jgi:hypothetical protein